MGPCFGRSRVSVSTFYLENLSQIPDSRFFLCPKSKVNQHQSPKYFSAIYSQPPYLLVFLEICWPVTLHIPRLEEGWSFEVLTHTNHLRLQCCRRGFVRDTQLSVSRNVMVLKFKLSSPRPEQRRVSRACIVGGNVAGIHWHYINCKCPES